MRIAANLHEIRVRLFARDSERNLESHFTESKPIVVAARVCLEYNSEFLDFLYEKLGDGLALRLHG